MLIVAKQSFECKHPQTGEKYVCRCLDVVIPPDWVAADPYFKALCDDGLITCHIDSKSVDAQIEAKPEAQDKAKKGKK